VIVLFFVCGDSFSLYLLLLSLLLCRAFVVSLIDGGAAGTKEGKVLSFLTALFNPEREKSAPTHPPTTKNRKRTARNTKKGRHMPL
jgi:hypothetical protein